MFNKYGHVMHRLKGESPVIGSKPTVLGSRGLSKSKYSLCANSCPQKNKPAQDRRSQPSTRNEVSHRNAVKQLWLCTFVLLASHQRCLRKEKNNNNNFPTRKTNKLDMLDEMEMVPHCSLAGKPVYIMQAL